MGSRAMGYSWIWIKLNFFKNRDNEIDTLLQDKNIYADVSKLLPLNEEKDIPRNEISESYTHIAFSIDEANLDKMYEKLDDIISSWLGV